MFSQNKWFLSKEKGLCLREKRQAIIKNNMRIFYRYKNNPKIILKKNMLSASCHHFPLLKKPVNKLKI